MKKIYADNIDLDTYKLWIDKQITTKEYSKLLGLTSSQLYRLLKYKNLVGVTHKVRSNVNHFYFNDVNSEDKAYLLGFFAADGNLNAKNDFHISVSESDFYITELYRNFLSPYTPISESKSRNFHLNGKDYVTKSMKMFSVRSTHICDALRNFGFVENKTQKEFVVPELGEFTRHFIRGYFDGDGTISFSKNPRKNHINNTYTFAITCHTDSILRSISNHFNNNVGVSGRVAQYKGNYVLTICGRENTYQVLSYLYKDSTYRLERKYDKYLQIVEDRNLRLEQLKAANDN